MLKTEWANSQNGFGNLSQQKMAASNQNNEVGNLFHL